MSWRPTPPRDTKDWRALAATTLFLSGWLVVTIFTDDHGLSLVFLVCLVPMSFVAGYLHRAAVASSGHLHRLRFLRVKGDTVEDEIDGTPTP